MASPTICLRFVCSGCIQREKLVFDQKISFAVDMRKLSLLVVVVCVLSARVLVCNSGNGNNCLFDIGVFMAD